MALAKTPLYEEQIKAGAKMAEFAGWEMPLDYGSQITEHNTVRTDAGMFDISHMNIIDFTGPDAAVCLRHLLANDVAKLKKIGQALYSCMLNPAGGIVDDCIVYRLNTENYRLIANAATHDKDLAWIKQHSKAFDLEVVEQKSVAMIAIQGPKARKKSHEVFTNKQHTAAKKLKNFEAATVDGWWIARTGYTGEDGYEVILPQEEAVSFWRNLLAAEVKPCGLVARDSLRLGAGLNLYGADIDETTSPLESNLGWTIAWEPKEREFIGRTALEKQRKAGVKHNIFGLMLAKGKGIMRAQQKVKAKELGEGEITSGGFSPTLGHSIALARLPIGARFGDHCFVEIHGKKVEATVIKPPFTNTKEEVSQSGENNNE